LLFGLRIGSDRAEVAGGCRQICFGSEGRRRKWAHHSIVTVWRKVVYTPLHSWLASVPVALATCPGMRPGDDLRQPRSSPSSRPECDPEIRHKAARLLAPSQPIWERNSLAPHLDLRLFALPTKLTLDFFPVLVRLAGLQSPSVSAFVIRKALQYLVEPIPDMGPHGSVRSERITAAQRPGQNRM